VTSDSAPIRILIVDDHPALRAGLRHILTSDDIEIVGEAINGTEVVALCKELDPDIVLMDIRMPEMDGLTAMHEMKRNAVHAKIIVLTAHWHHQYLVRSLMYGASGFFLKSVLGGELREAIRKVASGKNLLAIPEVPRLVDRLRREEAGLAPVAVRKMGKLSGREREVLRLMVQGMSNRKIAEYLGIGPATAKTHVENVMKKLGVSDRTQAAVWAVYSGTIEP